MDLKWLEDLLVLLEEKSFTRAAQQQHVTQPAFSRRIRLLEEWLGVNLADRSCKPVKILPAGLALEADIRDLVNRLYALRNKVRTNAEHEDRISFVAQHTLAMSRFPRLIRSIKQLLPQTAYRVNPANNHDCEALFLKEADFLFCYETSHQQFKFANRRVRRIHVGKDRLLPVASAPLLQHYGSVAALLGDTIPMLMYQQGGFLAEVLEATCLPAVLRDYRINVICESGFSASLKEMALADMGVAWLSQAMIEEEIDNGRLISLEQQLGIAELDVVLYYLDENQSAHAALVFQALLTIFDQVSTEQHSG